MAMSYPSPIGIILPTTRNGKAKKACTQHFYGKSYTVPTPKEYILQKLGLCSSNCIALRIPDTKLCSLVPATHPHAGDSTPSPPSNCTVVKSYISSISSSLRSDFGNAACLWLPHAASSQVSHFSADPPLTTTQTRLNNIGVA